MKRIFFHTTRELQEWIISHATPEEVVLTAGGRMARQVLHLFREEKVREGASAWLPIRIMSLNEWVQRIWVLMWPEYISASELRRLLIWEEAMQVIPPPGASFEGISIAKELDETYTILVRHLIDPCEREVATPLARWSLEVTQVFVTVMRSKGFVHPAEIPLLLSRAFSGEHSGKMLAMPQSEMPKRVILAELSQASPLEMELFSSLAKMTEVVWLEIEENGEDIPERIQAFSFSNAVNKRLQAYSFPDSENEVAWVVEKAIESSACFPLHRIGIAVTDMKTYGCLFERAFEEITGERGGEGWSSFNITLGRPLIQSSLTQAALLPFRLVLEGELRIHLLSLLQSPYNALWARQHHTLSMLDIHWRKANLERGLAELMGCIESKYPVEANILRGLIDILEPLLQPLLKKSVAEWNKSIRAIWRKLEFPVIAREEDRISWVHIQELIEELDREMGDEYLKVTDYFKWLSSFLNTTLFSRSGLENAGFQIMGLIEARGLSFDQLYIVGMVSGAIPQPVRPLPLLSSKERKMVQGGTVEDQYRFAHSLFSRLTSSAPCLFLTRPEQSEGEPLVPSPFFPAEKNIPLSVDIWHAQSPVWARSRWLLQTKKGMERGKEVHLKNLLSRENLALELCHEPVPLPLTLSVTALEEGIACPFRFFISHCLNLSPLEDPKSGIPPRKKGEMIHKCLDTFVQEVIKKGLDLIEDREEVRQLLKKTAQTILSPFSDSFLWQVELRRWLGLLFTWLQEETFNWEKGYRWLCSEVSFSNLFIGGYSFPVSGRIDRVDIHPEIGYICRDYKTGRAPSIKEIKELRNSQIFPYLMAIQKGLIEVNAPPGKPATAGYIQIDSEGTVNISEISFEEGEMEEIIRKWEERVLGLFQKLIRGDVSPFPTPAPTRKDEGACAWCPAQALCGYTFLWKKGGIFSQDGEKTIITQ